MKTQPTFVLIDSNAVMHRAFHALPPLTAKGGQLVSVVYGFTAVLLKIIKDLRPDYVACAFDVAGGTFRDEIFAQYKAGRQKPDQEFYDQIDGVKEVVRAMNVPLFEMPGFEADDVIGTLAQKIGAQADVYIATGDMDAMQLVGEKVKVYAFKKGISETVIYDANKVEERYGITPGQVVDYKALRGDASDNIPGIKGVGEKTATALLQEFGSLENLYARIDAGKAGTLKPKLLEKLVAGKGDAFLSRELATIRRDVPLEFDLAACRWGDYDREKVAETFRKFEFFSLIGRLGELEKAGGEKPAPAPAPEIAPEYRREKVRCRVVETEADVQLLFARLSGGKEYVFQAEESGHRIATRQLTGLFFSFPGAELFYVPVAPAPQGAQTLFGAARTKNDFLERLRPFLESDMPGKIGFDQKRDMEALAAYGIRLGGLRFDVKLAAYLLDPGKRDYRLEKVLFEHLGLSGACEVDGAPESKPEWGWLNCLFYFREKLARDLRRSEMERLFFKIEMPLIPVLCAIEMTGVKIDASLLGEIARETDAEIKRLEAKIHELSGDADFNLNSSRQLAEVLFEKMHLSSRDIKKGKTGYSVAASELEKMRESHPIIDFISEYRELAKLKSTYIDTLPKLVNPETGRLHTTFTQDVTATGRLSSTDPNLQNIPVRTPIGRRIRAAFVAEEGRMLLSADYSQIELRIIATLADDEKMQEIFRQHLDIHSATAARVNRVPLEKVTSEMRRAAKALNFGVIYGMSVFGFSRAAGIDRGSAKRFIDDYMREFSAVARYIEESKQRALEKGYAETLWGRRRYLPELKSSNGLVRTAAERMAINMPIQGTAADLMKINMLKIDEWAREYNRQHPDAVRVLLQVHDELLFSLREDCRAAGEEIRRIMESGHIKFDGHDIVFKVPIEVSLKSGRNWGELE